MVSAMKKILWGNEQEREWEGGFLIKLSEKDSES